MKSKVAVMVLLLCTAVPGLLWAHPGHGHEGSLLDTFLHYVATWYILALPVLGLAIWLVVRRLRTAKARN